MNTEKPEKVSTQFFEVKSGKPQPVYLILNQILTKH